MSQISRDILSDITVHMKYAKYIPELNRRETWGELVTRNLEMHVKKYPELAEQMKVFPCVGKCLRNTLTNIICL